MTKEEKQLLFKDLCARLPYSVVVHCTDSDTDDYNCFLTTDILHEIQIGYEYYDYKPYLRPMSSMTEEEKKVVCSMNMISDTELNDRLNYQRMYVQNYTIETFDYFNERKLDYRGLIEKGLAIEAPEGMYEIHT